MGTAACGRQERREVGSRRFKNCIWDASLRQGTSSHANLPAKQNQNLRASRHELLPLKALRSPVQCGVGRLISVICADSRIPKLVFHCRRGPQASPKGMLFHRGCPQKGVSAASDRTLPKIRGRRSTLPWFLLVFWRFGVMWMPVLGEVLE